MAYELKDGQGTIFLNQNKKQDNHPDFQGEILLEGKKWKLAGWEKSGATNGKNWRLISLSVDRRDAGNARPTVREVDPFKDSDIPF